MSDPKTILKTIDDAVNKLSNSVEAKQNPLYKEIVNRLQKLQTRDGAILNNIENLKIINDIKVKLEKIIIDDKYKSQLKAFAGAYDDVAELQNQYFASFATKFKPPKAVDVLRTSAIETTITNLTEAGIQVGVTEGMRKIMLTNMQQGGSMADLTEQLKGYMVGDDKVDGALLKYVKGYATTAINQYSREYNQQIAEDLDLEWHQYTGSLLTTSRPFCVKAVKKRWVHDSEIPELLKGDFGELGKVDLVKSTGLPAGMMEGTNVDNFPRRLGGWQCGHSFAATDESIVPQDVKDAVYSTQTYKAWAATHGKKVKKTSVEIAIQDVMSKAKQAAPEINEIGKDYANKYGGKVTPINFKSEESIKRKTNDELGGDVSLLKDAVRNTVVVPYEKLNKVAADLKSDDRFIRVKIQEGDGFYGYKGILTNVKTENGIIAEMQVNSPGMIYAKEPKSIALNYMSETKYNEIATKTGLAGGLGHEYYNEIRVINPATATIEQLMHRDELIQKSKDYYKNFYGF